MCSSELGHGPRSTGRRADAGPGARGRPREVPTWGFCPRHLLFDPAELRAGPARRWPRHSRRGPGSGTGLTGNSGRGHQRREDAGGPPGGRLLDPGHGEWPSWGRNPPSQGGGTLHWSRGHSQLTHRQGAGRAPGTLRPRGLHHSGHSLQLQPRLAEGREPGMHAGTSSGQGPQPYVFSPILSLPSVTNGTNQMHEPRRTYAGDSLLSLAPSADRSPASMSLTAVGPLRQGPHVPRAPRRLTCTSESASTCCSWNHVSRLWYFCRSSFRMATFPGGSTQRGPVTRAPTHPPSGAGSSRHHCQSLQTGNPEQIVGKETTQ